MLSTRDFESMLHRYLKGALSDTQRALVDGYLQAHPEKEIQVRSNGETPSDREEPAEDAPPLLGTGSLARAGPPGQITLLLHRMRTGDAGARDRLFALAYGELKRLAHVRLYHGGRNNLLDTTALVSEAYIRFVKSSQLRSEDRRSFFAFASQVMRNVIVDTARTRLAQRRGGGAAELTLSTQLMEHLSSGEEAILDVHEALLVLEQAEPRLAQLVEMRYYGGYTEAEIAETMGVTERTVQRDWKKARLLLKAALARRR